MIDSRVNYVSSTDIHSMAGHKAGVMEAVQDYYRGRAGGQTSRQMTGSYLLGRPGQASTPCIRAEGLVYQDVVRRVGPGQAHPDGQGRPGRYTKERKCCSAKALPPKGPGVTVNNTFVCINFFVAGN